ncbi:MAG: glycosyltransferase [Candidatus Eisenbacteria bacterium]|nr:glycosyltransferase [Candidatus Eisenbacteria bacterium]
MKVAFVNSMRSIGGGERWLLEVASGLGERGHDVAVVTRRDAELTAAAAHDGHRVLELPMSSDFDPPSVLRLATWLARERPDVVSVNVQRAVRIGCAAARLARTGTVVERRGLNFPARPSTLNRWIYGRCVSAVIANCGEIARQMVDAGLVPPERVVVVPNGIDPARVPAGGGGAIREQLGIDRDTPLVAMVARLVRDKGHAYAFEAFGRLLGRHPRARLVLVGAGKLEGELREKAARAAPVGSIVFLGARDDVPAILDAADVLLVSSLREGMPHSVLEAMVAGTPVVATAVAGIPEMIRSGEDGILVPAADPGAIAGALESVLADRSHAERLAESAGRRVRETFGLERMITETERVFAAAVRGVVSS